MPRVPSSPHFPDSSSRWLANFRYQQLDEDGHRRSPEVLGSQIGVSGATIRRWESGQMIPSQDDLKRFAEVCGLTAMQTEFVHRLFSRRNAQDVEVPECFQEEALNLLSVPRAAFILDELFFIRGWNSYFTDFLGPLQSRLRFGANSAKFLLVLPNMPEPLADRGRIDPLVRLLWMWTAHLGAKQQYAELIQDLSSNEEFAHAWQALACRVNWEAETPVIYPGQREIRGASHRIYTREILFPPLYRLVTWEPADETAEKILQGQIAAGPPQVGFADKLHWSLS